MKTVKIMTIALWLPMLLQAQQDRWEASLWAGYSNYLGDLVDPVFTFANPSIALGGIGRYYLTENLALRTHLLYGKLQGTDLYEARGYNFESSILEAAMVGEYDFLRHKRYRLDGAFQRTFSVYSFAGVGVAWLSEFEANGDGGEYKDYCYSVPIGAGVRYFLNPELHVGLELGGRLSFGDHLDGVSLRGDPDDNDAYYMGGLTLGFNFGSRRDPWDYPRRNRFHNYSGRGF
jgi:hypothetical protein